MKILNPVNKFIEHTTSFIFIDSLIFDYIIKQLSIFHKLHHKKQLFGSLYDLIKLYETRVTNKFENMDLSGYSFDVCNITEFFLLKKFNSNFLFGEFMGRQSNFTERSFAQNFAYYIVTDLFGLSVSCILIEILPIIHFDISFEF